MAWDFHESIEYFRRQGAPGDQTALVSLLREVQQEQGGSLQPEDVNRIAEELGVKQTYLLAVIKRFPGLRLGNTHCLELCAGPNCSKRAALASFVEKTYGSSPKTFTLKYVPCMRLCGKGPNIKWDGTLYHGADENLIRSLVEGETEC